MRKGITPVISIVLLLLIVVAIIGIAFGWFVGIFNVAAEEGTAGIENLALNKLAVLDSALCTDSANPDEDVLTLYIKASGSDDLAVGEVSVYLDDVLLGNNDAIISSGSTEQFDFTDGAGTPALDFDCTTAIEVRITDPAGTSSKKTLS